MNLYEENIKQLTEISNFLQLTQPAPINKKYQCTISDAISAFKTLEDMGTPLPPRQIDLGGIFTLMVNPNVSRETIEEASCYVCGSLDCSTCEYNIDLPYCIASLSSFYLKALKKQAK